jgi:restriction system protein
LTAQAKQVEEVNPQDVVRTINALAKKNGENKDVSHVPPGILEEEEWKLKLHGLLTEKLSAAAFERLVQRVLRESGFTRVEVTGRSGDEGIDGRGVARINGVMSFHVHFQCKRYKGAVGSGEIRDFRGAMVGRADKGLFITTGTFTSAAVKEATRDGAPPIDLLDGNELADKLKELRLGVRIEHIEKIHIEDAWFENV